MSDGTTAQAGGKVIKNVAGYDLAKLFTGSFGTLGVILELAVRLHPRLPRSVTVCGRAEDSDLLAGAASAMAHARLEMQALDVHWKDGAGAVLGRFGGTTAADQADAARARLDAEGLDAEVLEDDDEVWDAQRRGQRAPGGATVRVSGDQSGLGVLLRAASDAGASVTGRAALGLYWVGIPAGEADALIGAVESLRARLAPWPCVVQGAPAEVRTAVDPWGVAEGPELELMRRVKAHFDPHGVCNTGLYAGGI
jgi:glycolate oxidase FAD binding subunit